jgi:SWIM zinc finger
MQTGSLYGTDSETAQDVVGPAEHLAQEQMCLSHNYSVVRVDEDTFLCRFCTLHQGPVQLTPWMPESTDESDWEKRRRRELGWKIPRYLHTRTLKIKKHHNGTLYMSCDCKYFNQFGILCRHSCAVLGKVRLEHFHPRNLQQYLAHYKRPNYGEVTKLLQSMVEANLPGPVLAKADLEHIA